MLTVGRIPRGGRCCSLRWPSAHPHASLGRAYLPTGHGLFPSSVVIMFLPWACLLPLCSNPWCLSIHNEPPAHDKALGPLHLARGHSKEGKIFSRQQYRSIVRGVGPRSFGVGSSRAPFSCTCLAVWLSTRGSPLVDSISQSIAQQNEQLSNKPAILCLALQKGSR